MSRMTKKSNMRAFQPSKEFKLVTPESQEHTTLKQVNQSTIILMIFYDTYFFPVN
jgi:hypothetical protein